MEDDPEFDVKKAQKKLRRYVEGHDHAIRLKTEIMVDHFHEQVIAKNKIVLSHNERASGCFVSHQYSARSAMNECTWTSCASSA